MAILSPTNLETANYGTVGWNAIYTSNFQKLNTYLAKFEDLWNITASDWNILRYSTSSGKWIKDTISNLSTQLATYLAKIDLSNVSDNTILNKLLNVDGSGSGLDADKLDGQDSSYYLNRANHTGTQPPSTISPQGSGSDLDADKVDGFHASQTPATNVVPVTNSNGKLAKNWLKTNISTIDENYETTSSDEYLLCDASSGNITITLTNNAEQLLIIKKIDSSTNTVTISPSSGTIDGQSSIILSNQYDVYRLICDGTNWWIV